MVAMMMNHIPLRLVATKIRTHAMPMSRKLESHNSQPARDKNIEQSLPLNQSSPGSVVIACRARGSYSHRVFELSRVVWVNATSG